MKNEKKKENLLDKALEKMIRANLDSDLLTWPPVCPFITYQPVRPMAKPESQNETT